MINRHSYRGRRYKSNRSKVFISSPLVDDRGIPNPNSLKVSRIQKKSESVYRAFCKIHTDKRSRRQLLEDQQERHTIQRFGFNISQKRSSKSITMFSEARKGLTERVMRISAHNHKHPPSVLSKKSCDYNNHYTYLEPDKSFSHETFTVLKPLHHSNTFTEVSNRCQDDYQAETNIRRQKTLVVKLPSVANSEPDSESRPEPFPTLNDYRATFSKQHSGLSDKIVSKLKYINAEPTTPKFNACEQKVLIHSQQKREATSLSVVSVYDNKSVGIPQIKVSRCKLVNNTPTFKTNAIVSLGHGEKMMFNKKVDILPCIACPNLPKISLRLNEYKGSKLIQRNSPLSNLSKKTSAVDPFCIAHINQKRATAQRRLRKSTVTMKQSGPVDELFLPHHFPLRRIDTINTVTKDKIGKRLEYETDIRALLHQKTTLRVDKRCDTEFDFKLLTIEPWRRVPDYDKITQQKRTAQFELSQINFATKIPVSSRKQHAKLFKTSHFTERYTDADIDKEEVEEQPKFEFIIRNSLRPIQTVVRE